MPDDCEVCAGDCGGAVGTVSFDFPGVRMSVPFGQGCLDAVVWTMARQWNYAVARQNEATNAWAAMLGLDFSAGGASTREGEAARLDAEQPPVDRGAGAANTGAPTMCSSGDHGDVPAVGDALTDETEEEPDDERYPYCGECLDTLGADYEARRWDGPAAGGATDG